ncbi:MAG: cell division protein ZapB [Desulfamplus sp.]|nr:cell division protein ZapB [Desulfamplus sp.]MBF0243381.1 cell division protein ZapB [Desulfamplus sp.]MBF0390903.1 cell division protein ZapB [Desulfamplus sp.]
MENEVIDKKFNDIDEKVDFIIELCQTLQAENAELTSKVAILESEIKEKREKESLQLEQQTAIQAKIDKLLSKLDNFSEIL